METTIKTDVLIAGAGPVGLSLAAELSRWGVSFRIVDKKDRPEQYSKAASFWPRTQEVTNAMGFYQRLNTQAVKILTSQIVAYGKPIAAVPMGPYDSPFAHVKSVEQGTIESTIVAFLAERGHMVEYGTEVTAVESSAEEVRVTLLHGGQPEVVMCRYVVGCDSTRSMVRQAAGLVMERHLVPNKVLRQIDARLTWSRPTQQGVFYFYIMDAGFCGIIDMPGGLTRVFWAGDEAGVPDRLPTEAEMQDVVREVANDLEARLSDSVWYSHGHFSYGVADQLRAGRIFLAGDAGQYTMPVGGQGMNTGIQDAFNLGWKLGMVLKGQAQPVLLDSYNEERQVVKAELMRDQVSNFDRLNSTTALEKLAFTWFGPFIVRHQKGVELGNRDESQLSIHYPKSLLTDEHLGNRGIKAGDRAPEAVVVRRDTLTDFSLFAQIYQLGWTLLVFDDGEDILPAWASVFERLEYQYPMVSPFLVLAKPTPKPGMVAANQQLLDYDRMAHEKYKINRPMAFLIRPDGYVGLRCGVSEPGLIIDYADRILATHVAAEPVFSL